MKTTILGIILILLETLSLFSVESSLVSKYSRTPRVTKGSYKKVNFVMEKFTHGICKHGDLDLFLYDITAGQCIQECRARTMCKSINMFLRVNWCRINFEENLVLNEKCPNYHYSNKADWIQKSEVGCESLNCSIIEKCMKRDEKYACVITECMNIPHLENGQVFGNDVKPGLTQAFMCNQGYEIKGDYRVTCQADGTWSPEIPTCIDKKKAASDTPLMDEESASSSSKSADVTAIPSFTTQTTTATSTTSETTPAATKTASPTTTSLTTTKTTSQASTLGTTTVSSAASTAAVTTQTQFASDVATSRGVSRERDNGEASCPQDKLIVSPDSCYRCPFAQVYDPDADECVKRVVQSSVVNGVGSYECSYYKYNRAASSDASSLMGDSVFLRNCDCDQVRNTFQTFVDVGIDNSTNNIEPFDVMQNTDPTQCLLDCSEDPRCALVQVTDSDEQYGCEIYGPVPDYSLILVDYKGRTVYLRNCE